MTGHPDLTPILRGDELPRAERQELLAHLRSCSGCRARMADEDPSTLFSLLALEPVPDTVLARVSRGAADGIARESRRISTRRAAALGSLAASVLLAAVLGVYLRSQTGSPTAPPIPVQLVDVVETDATSDAESAISAGFFEVLDSPSSADVVRMAVDEVDFVMIFDEELDI